LPDARIDFYIDALKSKGVIAKVGGYLSHLAINCCEKEIPFIISDEKYQEGELVFLDENNKKVVRLDNIKVE
jgi:phosphoenolpyruvate-protein kinase (PTS system EI component)